MNKSESITNLAVALVKFNSEIGKVSKDASNPFFKNKYATLDNIIDEARPILTKNGLSIMQIPAGDGENVIMRTLLLHESGEWLESDNLIMKPTKNDPQAIGSCITYARRYSITSFLSLNTGEDDDGNHASAKTNTTPIKEVVQIPLEKPKAGKLSDAQVKRLYAIAYKAGYQRDKVKTDISKKYSVDIADMTKAQYDHVCATYETLVKAEEPEPEEIPWE